MFLKVELVKDFVVADMGRWGDWGDGNTINKKFTMLYCFQIYIFMLS